MHKMSSVETAMTRRREQETPSNRPSQPATNKVSEMDRMSLTISVLDGSAPRIRALVVADGASDTAFERQSLACAYAALALKRTSSTPDAVVHARELHAMEPWRASKIHNIAVTFGSRHVGQTLPGLGLGDLIRCEGLTKAWALTLPPECISFEPSRAQVQAWCDGLGRSAAVDPGAIVDWQWLSHALNGMLATETRAPWSDPTSADAYIAQMRGIAPENSLMATVAGFLNVRAQSQLGSAPLDQAVSDLRRHADTLKQDGNALAEALGMRALAIQHYHDRTLRETLPQSALELEQAIARARQIGDLGALAQLHDTLGLVLMQLDPISEGTRNRARGALHQALILQMLDGDRMRLQATLRRAVLLEALPSLYWREPASDELLKLHQLSSDVCTAFGPLAPSAQSACLGILLHSSRGQFEQASQWLRRADCALDGVDHRLEHGFRQLAEAHYWWARSEDPGTDPSWHSRSEATDCLKRAREHYRQFGDIHFERLIALQLRALTRRQAVDREAVAALFGKGGAGMCESE